MYKTAILMGSDSDMPVAKKAIDKLNELGIPTDVRILSAHRTPEAVQAFAASARERGYGVVIAIAGKAAYLAGAVAAWTTLPVIGVPVGAQTGLGGIDALLSTVQMPSGVPVATVAIDGAENAAILAAEMLAIADAELANALRDMRNCMTQRVLAKDEALAGM